jgi:hypothetical protein
MIDHVGQLLRPCIVNIVAKTKNVVDSGHNEVYLLDRSARGLWTLNELIPTGISRDTFPRSGTRCEDCRAFPPLESRHWMMTFD